VKIKRTLCIGLSLILIVLAAPFASHGDAFLGISLGDYYIYDGQSGTVENIPGVNFDRASNTLTITDLVEPKYMLDVILPQKDLKLVIKGECSLAHITAEVSALYIEGDGTLTVNKNRFVGNAIECYGKSGFKFIVGNDTNLNLYSGSDSNVIVELNVSDYFDPATDFLIHGKTPGYEVETFDYTSIYTITGDKLTVGNGIEIPGPKPISGTFQYKSNVNEGVLGNYDFYFNEEWFSQNASDYIHALAKMSIRMAMAGAYKYKSLIKDLYDKLGFEYTGESISYPTPYFEYDTLKHDSSIGYAIGSKVLNPNVAADCTLVAVTVRGGGYESEWADNFYIGTGSEHAGFSSAASKVTKAVENYIAKNVKTKNVKIWITGFSRGAAVSNITAHNLNAWSKSVKDHVITTDGIYAYCFECPRTVRKDHPSYSKNEPNIINIVNDGDIVTKVAPVDWGFYRYGCDYYLPTCNFACSTERYKRQNEELAKILSRASLGAASAQLWAVALSAGIKNQVSITTETVSALASFFTSQSVYSNGYEDTMCKIAGETLGGDDYQSGSIFSALVTGFPAFTVLHPKITTRLVAEGGKVFYAHYPEVCLSWIDSLDGKNSYVSPRSRKLTIACPVDVAVYDMGRNLVASFVDGAEEELEDSMIEFYVNEDGEMIVILPCDGEYTVEITATDDGTMTYRVEDTNPLNEYERTLEFTDVEIDDDSVYIAEVPVIYYSDDVSRARYSLSDEDGNYYDPDIDELHYNPFTDLKYGSWYFDSVLWCFDHELMSGTSLTTFSPNTAVSRAMFVTVLAKIDGADVYGYETTSFDDVPAGKWYTKPVEWAFKNGFASGVGGGRFNPNGSVTREQLAVFLCNYCRKKGMDVDEAITAGNEKMGAFTDAGSISGWALEGVKWALGAGMISGTSATTVSPKNSASRAQLAVILKQFNENVLKEEPVGDDSTLRVASSYTGNFSLFQGNQADDREIVSLTQLSLISTDRRGDPVLKGIEGETRDYNGTDYTYYGPADITVTENRDGTVTYDIRIREDMKFSDGVPVTIDDVLFTMYVLSDPTYDGSSSFFSLPIEGMDDYRSDIAVLLDLLIAAGRENTDFTYWDEATQTAFWTGYDAAVRALAEEIVAYCEDNGWVEEGDIRDAAAIWEFDIEENTIEAFVAALEAAYGSDVANMFNNESAGSSVYDLFPNLADFQIGVQIGEPVKTITGLVKTGDHSLRIKMTEIDATAVYQLGVSIAPLHYYGDAGLFSLEEGSESFGFPKGDLSGIRKKTVPLGAGPYRFVSESDGKVTLEKNAGYYLGEPQISFVEFVHADQSNVVADVVNGVYDISSVGYSADAIEEIREANGGGLSGSVIRTEEIDNLGYGYVGLNADNVKVGDDKGSQASRDYRKAIATAMALFREEAIASYYGDRAHVLEYPISSTSWACPQRTDEGFRVAFSRDVNGNEIYAEGMTDEEKREAAKTAILGFFEAAGFTVEGGKLTAAPDGASLGVTAILPGSGGGDHPTAQVLYGASALLAEIGYDLRINDITNTMDLWYGLDDGTVAVWAAAWGSSIDPDMYQIYFSGDGQRDAGNSNYMYGVDDDALNAFILAARSTVDQAERKSIYKQCLDIIMDWAVELPVYQRKNAMIFSAERIDLDSLAKDITPFYGWTSEIETLRLNPVSE